MIEIKGKIYRNLQEQVAENQKDIEELSKHIPYEPVFYNKEEIDANFYNKEEANDLFYNKTAADNKFVSEVFEPENTELEFFIGYQNNDKIKLFGGDAEGNHPTDSSVVIEPNSITIETNSYNHGDNDDTYTSSVEITPTEIVAHKFDPLDDTYKQYVLTRYGVKHDLLLTVVDEDNHDGIVHMIIFDNYEQEYDYSKLVNTFRGEIIPEYYYTFINNVALGNDSRRYVLTFYIDNTDELWVEEEEDYYFGTTYTEETGNKYQITAVSDKITTF